MNKQLKSLDYFIKGKLQLLSTSLTVAAEDIKKWEGYIEYTADEIYHDVKMEVIQLDSNVKVELFIQHYHSTLIGILNAVTNVVHIPSNNLPEPVKHFLTQATLAIERLLSYTERYFSNFNYKLEVPVLYLDNVKTEIRENVHTVRKNLTEKDNVKLLRVVLFPIEEFLEDDNHYVTYRQLLYLKYLSADLALLRTNVHVNTQIKEVLVKWNWNSEDFIQLIKTGIDEGLAQCNSLQERIDMLLLWTKQNKQIIIKKNAALHEDHISAIDFANQYIQEELVFLQKNQQSSEDLDPVLPAAKGERNSSDNIQKITTSMNLSELGAFIKVLIESGILPNAIVLEIIRHFADHFRTSNREQLKFESLRTKFYDIEPNTGKAVIAIFTKMSQTARSLF